VPMDDLVIEITFVASERRSGRAETEYRVFHHRLSRPDRLAEVHKMTVAIFVALRRRNCDVLRLGYLARFRRILFIVLRHKRFFHVVGKGLVHIPSAVSGGLGQEMFLQHKIIPAQVDDPLGPHYPGTLSAAGTVREIYPE